MHGIKVPCKGLDDNVICVRLRYLKRDVIERRLRHMENGGSKRMCQYYCIDCIVTKWDEMHFDTVLFHGIVELLC